MMYLVDPLTPVPVPPRDAFLPVPASDGVSITTYEGGTTDDLDAAMDRIGAVTASVTHLGQFIIYVQGAPAFANRDFIEHFDGLIPDDTPMLVKV